MEEKKEMMLTNAQNILRLAVSGMDRLDAAEFYKELADRCICESYRLAGEIDLGSADKSETNK